MRFMRPAIFAALLVAAMPLAFGQGGMVGKKAPDFKATNLINEAEHVDMREMLGEVVLVKYWGIK